MGPLIQDWEKFGSISKAAKTKASVLIVGMFTVTFMLVNVGLAVKVLIGVMGISVLSFIWTRPLPPNEQVLQVKVVVE